MKWHRCRHHWNVTGQRFVPPTRRNIEGWGLDFEGLLPGVTVTGLRCELCGKVDTRRDYGDVREIWTVPK